MAIKNTTAKKAGKKVAGATKTKTVEKVAASPKKTTAKKTTPKTKKTAANAKKPISAKAVTEKTPSKKAKATIKTVKKEATPKKTASKAATVKKTTIKKVDNKKAAPKVTKPSKKAAAAKVVEKPKKAATVKAKVVEKKKPATTKKTSPKKTVEKKQAAPKVAVKKSEPKVKVAIVSKPVESNDVKPAASKRRKKKTGETEHVIAIRETGRKKQHNPIVEHERVMTEFKPVGRSVLDSLSESKGPAYRYSDEDLIEFKELILTRLENAKRELVYLQGLITRKDEAGTEDTDNRYNHMEDGSGAMEREQLSQLAGRQIQFISHLESALVRIENKTYGICRVTGKLISKARLRAVPHATLSIEAKKLRK